MIIKVMLSTGEILSFSSDFSYAKFLVFTAPKHEYELLGEVPKLQLSPEIRKLSVIAARLRANKERNKKKNK